MPTVRHLGLIPDGARRWAKARGVPLGDAYSVSLDKVSDAAAALYAHGVGAVSVYLLSRANLKRTPAELDAIDAAVGRFFRGRLLTLLSSWRVAVRVAGRMDLLPPETARAASEILASASTATTERRLYLCLAYDPFDELIRAYDVGGPLDSKAAVLEALWVPEEIDLVVRTGGACTLSQFLPLQAGYARIVVLAALFNDIAAGEIVDIVSQHEHMHLRYGE